MPGRTIFASLISVCVCGYFLHVPSLIFFSKHSEKALYNNYTAPFLHIGEHVRWFHFCINMNQSLCLILRLATLRTYNNLRTNWHNKTTHALANIPLAYPTTRCFTLINVCRYNELTPNNTLLLWLLPCTCHLPRCIYFAHLRPYIQCMLGAPQWPTHNGYTTGY